MENFTEQDLLNTEDLIVVKYGTFWPRFWALLLDSLVLSIFTPLIIYNKTYWKSSILLIAITLVQLGYKSFFEFKYGATPGKMALKLKVVNHEYQNPLLNNVLLRNIFQLIAGIIALVINLYSFYNPAFSKTIETGYYTNEFWSLMILNGIALSIYIADLIVMLNNDKSRSWHDLIGETYVLKL